MFRLKIIVYISVIVRRRSVDQWIILTTYQVAETSWYGVNFLLVEISVNVLL